jgi:hypothetical protein
MVDRQNEEMTTVKVRSACVVRRFSYDAPPMVSASLPLPVFIFLGLALLAVVIVVVTLVPLA